MTVVAVCRCDRVVIAADSDFTCWVIAAGKPEGQGVRHFW